MKIIANRWFVMMGLLLMAFVALAEGQAAMWGAKPLQTPTRDDRSIFAKLVPKVVPSVVNVATSRALPNGSAQMSPDEILRKFFEEYFERRSWQPSYQPQLLPVRSSLVPHALGSGFIIDKTGIVLTNNHVVADADEILIHFTEAYEEQPTPAVVIGRDVELDVALLQVKTKRELVPLKLGNSDATEVGEYVMAVGNPFGQGHSASHGIISAKERISPEFPLVSYIQTDAPINPGNSGGPLVNLDGEAIGINNAILKGANGIGFAIPINAVKASLEQLRSKGRVERSFIGVSVGEVSPAIADKLGLSKEMRVPFISHLYPGEPAEKAGLQVYDVILQVNGKTIHSSVDLITSIASVPVGESVLLHILRNGQEMNVSVKTSKRPISDLNDPENPKNPKPQDPAQNELGMIVETLNSAHMRSLGAQELEGGVVVMSVDPNGPAARIGLRRGDVIVEVDRQAVRTAEEFFQKVQKRGAYLLRVKKYVPGASTDTYSVVVLDLSEEEGAS